MKTTRILLLLLFSMLQLLAAETPKTSADEKPRIAVLPFEDQTDPGSTLSVTSAFSQRSAPAFKWAANKYGRLARAMVETCLTKWDEVSVTDRQSLDLLQREVELIKRRGGNLKGIIEAKKKAGVTHYLFGELLQLGQQKWTFDEFGLQHSGTTTSARMRLRVVDLAKEDIVYSAEFEGTFEATKTQFGEDSNDDPGGKAVINAVESLIEKPSFRVDLLKALGRSLPPAAPEQRSVEVVFDSLPVGANIEVGDVYVGTGRLSRSLEHAERFEVRITKPGFAPWTGTIVAQEGLIVAPKLLPVPETQKPAPTP